jgi:hypothetical protein
MYREVKNILLSGTRLLMCGCFQDEQLCLSNNVPFNSMCNSMKAVVGTVHNINNHHTTKPRPQPTSPQNQPEFPSPLQQQHHREHDTPLRRPHNNNSKQPRTMVWTCHLCDAHNAHGRGWCGHCSHAPICLPVGIGRVGKVYPECCRVPVSKAAKTRERSKTESSINSK